MIRAMLRRLGNALMPPLVEGQRAPKWTPVDPPPGASVPTSALPGWHCNCRNGMRHAPGIGHFGPSTAAPTIAMTDGPMSAVPPPPSIPFNARAEQILQHLCEQTRHGGRPPVVNWPPPPPTPQSVQVTLHEGTAP